MVAHLFEGEHRARYSGQVVLRQLGHGKPMAKNPGNSITHGDSVKHYSCSTTGLTKAATYAARRSNSRLRWESRDISDLIFPLPVREGSPEGGSVPSAAQGVQLRGVFAGEVSNKHVRQWRQALYLIQPPQVLQGGRGRERRRHLLTLKVERAGDTVPS